MLLTIGLMSGTSMDGVDASLLYTDGINDIEIIANHSIPYNKEFRTLLKAAEYSCKKNNGSLAKCEIYFKEDLISFLTSELLLDKTEIAKFLNKNFITFTEVIHKSTIYHLQVINELFNLVPSISKSDIAVIGYHGQTLFHNPEMQKTIAIGKPQFLANELGIKVVFNFRQNDLLHGGQGAPLVPIYHQAMVSNFANNYPIALINCGGITNTTILPDKKLLIAHDIGAGACLLDRFIAKRTNNQHIMDTDGNFALQGKENSYLIQQLLKYSKVNNKPDSLNSWPKALDVNDFQLIEDLNQVSLEDGCRNLIIYTAESIILYFKRQNITPSSIILAGGGWNNPVLVSELKKRWHTKLNSKTIFLFSNELGFNSQYVESQAFGYMAIRRLRDLAISFPSTTGVAQPTIGGDIFLPEEN